jgi:D-tyrosyl-tRNA(Tyr) deacylase
VQRVREARVDVAGETVGAIGPGLLVFVCAEPVDTDAEAGKLVDKLLKLRIFSDAAGKMNLSLQDVAGGLLVVSQFTLAADTRGGNRPSFTGARPHSASDSRRCRAARERHAPVVGCSAPTCSARSRRPVTLPLRCAGARPQPRPQRRPGPAQTAAVGVEITPSSTWRRPRRCALCAPRRRDARGWARAGRCRRRLAHAGVIEHHEAGRPERKVAGARAAMRAADDNAPGRNHGFGDAVQQARGPPRPLRGVLNPRTGRRP